jgi:hypothetical protein
MGGMAYKVDDYFILANSYDSTSDRENFCILRPGNNLVGRVFCVFTRNIVVF